MREWVPFGCRLCLHLGYSSQVHRPNSIWAFLDEVFDRRPLRQRWWRRYEGEDNEVVRHVVAPMRALLAARIEAMFSRVTVGGEDGEDNTRGTDEAAAGAGGKPGAKGSDP